MFAGVAAGLHGLNVPVSVGVKRLDAHRRAIEPDATGSTMTTMSHRADPDRIHQARRAAIRNAIMQDRGLDQDVAERWCDAWEAEALLQGRERGRDFWDAGKVWIDRQCSARKQPPN
jgi:hypothetical protein